MNSSKKLFIYTLILIASGVIAFIAVAIFGTAVNTQRPVVKPTGTTVPAISLPTEERRTACKTHIQDADKRAQQAIREHAESFSQFINDRKAGSREFAKALNSFYAKWRVLKPYLPRTDPNGGKQYVADTFATHIFSEEELHTALTRSIRGAINDIEGIQNDLAVNLRKELLQTYETEKDAHAVQKQFQSEIDQLIKSAQWDAGKSIANMAVTETIAVLSVRVFTQLGIRAGILAAGAANSGWTIGASLIIGLLADIICTWIDDPVGDLEQAVNQSINNLAIESKATLISELTKLHTEKTALWKQAAENMIKEQR